MSCTKELYTYPNRKVAICIDEIVKTRDIIITIIDNRGGKT